MVTLELISKLPKSPGCSHPNLQQAQIKWYQKTTGTHIWWVEEKNLGPTVCLASQLATMLVSAVAEPSRSIDHFPRVKG